jgi:multicomponent Na+:H+ antiporter subunit D
MGGLYAANGLVSVLFLLLVFALAGVPPLLGFWPKLLLVKGGLAGLGAQADGAGDVALAFGILVNALLTLIAGTRLWSHIFWRPGPVGALAEVPNAALRALSPREAAFGAGAATLLTAGIVALSLWPEPLFAAGRIAATDLRDPLRYVMAVGLGGSP